LFQLQVRDSVSRKPLFDGHSKISYGFEAKKETFSKNKLEEQKKRSISYCGSSWEANNHLVKNFIFILFYLNQSYCMSLPKIRHCMPTFRCIHTLSGVLPLFTSGTPEYDMMSFYPFPVRHMPVCHSRFAIASSPNEPVCHSLT